MSARYHGEQFFIKGGQRAVLLLHGFTASTQEVEGLGIALAEAGYTVAAPLLPGHNRTFKDFRRTSAEAYAEAVRVAFDALHDYESIDVVGLSFGAALALDLAARRSVRRLVVLAPAIFYYNPLTRFAPLLQLYHGKVMKQLSRNPETGIESRWDLFKPEAIRERIAYPWISFPQLQSTRRFMRQVQGELGKVVSPILIIHSRLDTTTKPEGAQYVYDHVGSADKRLVWLEKSGHVITEDYEADIVQKEVVAFLQQA